MAHKPLPYHRVPDSPHKFARVAAFGMGWLYFLVALAVAAGMCVSAWLDRDGGPDAYNFSNPLFYVMLIGFTALLAAVGWGFCWAGGGIARGMPRRLLFGKYLAMLNVALVAMEAVGIAVGLFADPPKGADFAIALSACGISLFFLAALVLTIWLLERSVKAMQNEKEIP